MISSIAKLLSILNSETEPAQISIAAAFSMVAGLTPFLSLHNLLVLFLVLVIRVNLSTFLLGLAFFSAVAYLLDPLFHVIGFNVLTASFLKGFWTALYNSTFFRLTGFNNSILMGSLLFSLLMFVLLVFVLNYLIRKYREYILAWLIETRLIKAFMASRVYGYYTMYSNIRRRL